MVIRFVERSARFRRARPLGAPLLIMALLAALFAGARSPAPASTVDLGAVMPALATPAGRVPAVMALERLNCATINASGQAGIKVKGTGANGGWIHSDTAAVPGAQIVSPAGTSTSNCTSPAATACTTSIANTYSVYATQLPLAAGGGPAIIAEDGVTSGEPGKVGTYAMSPGVGGAIGCNYPSGINVPTTADPIISRAPVDARYNTSGAPFGTNIAAMHAAAYARTAAGVAPVGYATISGAACWTDRVVYQSDTFVDCPLGFTGQDVVFRGQHVVFSGRLQISGGYVAFPNATSIDVRGCNGCANGRAIDVASNGFLSINSGETGTDRNGWAFDVTTNLDEGTLPWSWSWPNISCATQRRGPGAGGSVTNATVVTTFGGSFGVQNGEGNFCQTAFYLAANAPTYVKLSTTTGGNCSPTLPCPAAGSLATFNLNAGSKPPISWTAPGQNTGGPSASSPFDHLALWTEGGQNTTCYLSGQGQPELAGVFFAPNCEFVYSAQADASVVNNVQLIVRTFTMGGQGILTLQPDPAQSIVPSTPRAPAWVSTVGGDGDELPRSVKVDADANSYLVGSFSGSAQFGFGADAQTVVSAGAMDGFLAKFDPAGALIWVQRIGSVGTDEVWGLALDSAGNPVVGGAFTGSVTFGTDPGAQTVSGSDDAFVAKYDASGALQWVRTAGGTDVDKTLGVAVDGNGFVYAAGIVASPTATFGATSLPNAGGIDGFVAQYGADGTPQWATRVAGAGQDFAKTVAGLPAGGAVVSGWFDGTLTAGTSGGQLTAVGTTDGFSIRVNADGSVAWLTDVGGVAFDLVWGSTADADGNVYLTGLFSGAATVGAGGPPGTLTAAGAADGFVARLDNTGQPAWSVAFGGAGIDLGLGVAVSGSTLYLSGAFAATASFGAASLVSAGALDGFVSQLSTAGTWQWTEPMAAGAGDGFGLDAATDPSGAVWVTGNFQSTVTFTSSTAAPQRSAIGGDDLYLAAINP